MVKIPDRLLTEARERGIVIMAGAGTSAAPPSSLPGWYRLNEMIVDALSDEVERYLGLPGYTNELRRKVHARRTDDQFPPDYQAQILEEACEDDYFRALQTLDVGATNSAHAGIARLAKHGVVRAIVTTNFDRLIEHALDSAEVPYEVQYDPAGYARCWLGLSTDAEPTSLQVIKLHGCVRDHRSMVDTLKQRLLGRNAHLLKCVTSLLRSHLWLYTGFSCADLETDPDYLGLIPNTKRSPGLVYVQWPGASELSRGARMLTTEYGEKASVVVAEVDELLATFADDLHASPPEISGATSADSAKHVATRLAQWASDLHPADKVMCLASVAEASGETFGAFELLHRFWKDHTAAEQDGDSFERYRLMHGRLGMGLGIMSFVDDLRRDRGMESFQNLLRVADRDVRSCAWASLAFAWAGKVNDGMSMLKGAEPVYTDAGTALEWKVDVWLALAELMFLTGEVNEFIESWGSVNQWAKEAGDLPRQARVATAHLLLMAEFQSELYEEFRSTYVLPILRRAQRLNDPSVDGFEALANGRYAVKQRQPEAAMEALERAVNQLDRAGRYPWCTYARIEFTKALMDSQRLDESAEHLDEINAIIDRYQVLLPWYEEARGQHHLLVGRPDIAKSAFEQAAEYAEVFGLKRRAEVYLTYMKE